MEQRNGNEKKNHNCREGHQSDSTSQGSDIYSLRNLDEKKKNRFSYKIKELMYSKIETLVFENLIKEEDINEFINHALEDGKFKIYNAIHQKFEDVQFEIKKKE